MERMTRRSVTTKRTIRPVAARLGFETDIVEAAGVPQDHEVAAEDVFVINIAGLGGDQGLEGVLRNAPGAAEFDGFDDLPVEGCWRSGRAGLGASQLRLAGLLRRLRWLLGWLLSHGAVSNGLPGGLLWLRRLPRRRLGAAAAASPPGACRRLLLLGGLRS